MPEGHKDTKHIPHHDNAQGNLPPVGQSAPGVYSGGTRATTTSNSSGMVGGGKGGKSSSGKAPQGNKYKGMGSNFSY